MSGEYDRPCVIPACKKQRQWILDERCLARLPKLARSRFNWETLTQWDNNERQERSLLALTCLHMYILMYSNTHATNMCSHTSKNPYTQIYTPHTYKNIHTNKIQLHCVKMFQPMTLYVYKACLSAFCHWWFWHHLNLCKSILQCLFHGLRINSHQSSCCEAKHDFQTQAILVFLGQGK